MTMTRTLSLIAALIVSIVFASGTLVADEIDWSCNSITELPDALREAKASGKLVLVGLSGGPG